MSNKNKVLITVLILLFSLLLLFGNTFIKPVLAEEIQEDILVRVQTLLVDNGIRVTIVYDVDTKVMYMISRGGGVCMLVDADGNPRLYENTH